MFGLIVWIAPVLDIFEDICQVRKSLLVQQSNCTDKPCYTPHGKGSTREAEQEDLIAGRVVIG
jgi:hypothetical protein